MVNTCWFFFKWGLVLSVLAAALAVPLVYRRVDEEIRSRIEAKLAAGFPGLTVHVRFAQLVQGEGIEVRGISIVERGAAGPQAELAYFDELFLTCQTTIQELVKGDPEVTHVKVRRPVLRATRRPDGSWSVAKLFPFPKLGKGQPIASIENGTIEIFDPLKSPATTLTLRDINLSLKPTVGDDPAELEPVLVEGYLSADQFQRVEIKGRADRRSSRCSLAGTVVGLEMSPELRSGLPREIAERLNPLGTLRCEGKLTFRIDHNVAATPPVRFEVIADLNRGRIDDRRLPFALSDLRGRVRVDNAGLIIDELQARNGQASLRVVGQRRGHATNSPACLEIWGTRIPLDQNLARVLPPDVRDQWTRFLPEGEVDAHGKLSFDGTRWTPEAEIKCLNASFTCYKFPYRLERCTGTIEHKNQRLSAKLVAFAGGQPVRIGIDLNNPGANFTGSIEAEGENIAFDEKLFAALPGNSRPIVRSLTPRGTFNFFMRQWRDDPQRAEPHLRLVVGMNRATINYDRFPYPLGNVRGTLEMIDGGWTFRDLEGTNDTGRVTAHGRLTAGPQGQLTLSLKGENVPLEEELRDALPPNVGRLWNSLKPRGAVDLDVELTHDSQTRQISIDLRARPRSETSSLEPIYFPYRLDKLRGSIHYRDGHTEFEGMEAVHGRTLVTTAGVCDIAPDDGFRLQLKNLSVDRLQANHELIAALPEGLRRIVGELKLTGALALRGNVAFSKAGSANAPLESNWDVVFDTQQAALEAGIRLENVYGAVKFNGSYDGQRFSSRGQLALDSATYKNFQLTEISGPIWIDNDHVLIGAWADSRAGSQTPQRGTAKIFGGTVQADCQVNLGSTAQYVLKAQLDDASLAEFAKENLSGRQRLAGKVLASVDLQGTGRSTHTLRGGGTIRLHDADIYELPVMVALLKILNLREPDTTAFTRSDIDFRVEGEHVLFDRINFAGDAISLMGLGQMNFDRQINLTFHVIGGNAEYQLPIFRNMVGQASKQIVQIRVEGSVDNPVTRSEAFPRVSQAIQKLQSDLQMNRDGSPPPPPPPPPPAAAAQTGGLLRSLNPLK